MKLSAALLAIALSAPMGLISPAAAEQLTRTELSPAQATAAAELLLEALKNRQGDVMHDALAAPVQASVDVKSVQARLDQRVAINATRVVSVIPGYNTTTVDAVVTTASGDEGMLMVLDEDGKLLAWKWTKQIQPIETTALDFTRDLAAGRWVAARSKMSLQLQEELAPGDLERKWTKLSQVSGGFRKVKDAVIAHQGGDQQLVLVAVAFGKATTNLFVIFDESGRIINVDISRDFV
ncbi:DUF3887 domain-containing protein [Synechococcus sp. YX-04-1]|uniref:DUF3887 domain-containing protein n=1 Tax=Synechococcus sp. YX-04-1 TaxID=3062778 RepID=UPI0026E45A18|nr:DUF3887 domain-containing protein [Synechococcus sp. YX-04-1]MDO6352039.1 DUF3887 domain-containing protein [Synechococcus sp. YX-04-1]